MFGIPLHNVHKSKSMYVFPFIVRAVLGVLGIFAFHET